MFVLFSKMHLLESKIILSVWHFKKLYIRIAGHILTDFLVNFFRIVRNRATEKAKAEFVHGTSPQPASGGVTQPQQIHPTPVITPASTAGYTIQTLLGINHPVALQTDVNAQKRKREEGG